jgi:hypothetical protein
VNLLHLNLLDRQLDLEHLRLFQLHLHHRHRHLNLFLYLYLAMDLKRHQDFLVGVKLEEYYLLRHLKLYLLVCLLDYLYLLF